MSIADLYIPALLCVGLLILLVAWLPLVLSRAPLSLPIVCVGIGVALGWVPQLAPLIPHPIETPRVVEKMAELIVIVSLMGAGLKIDHPLSFGGWRLTARLLVVAMPLGLLAFFFAGHVMLGLALPAALLLAAVLVPTDPVLAGDVQIERPDSHRDDEVRFALTSEAGLNDALAFPFVHLALAALASGFTAAMWRDWAIDAVAIRLTVGALMGAGRGVAGRLDHLPDAEQEEAVADGRRLRGAGRDPVDLRADRGGPRLRLPGGVRRRSDDAPRVGRTRFQRSAPRLRRRGRAAADDGAAGGVRRDDQRDSGC